MRVALRRSDAIVRDISERAMFQTSSRPSRPLFSSVPCESRRIRSVSQVPARLTLLIAFTAMTSILATSVKAEDNPEAVAQAYFAAMQSEGLLSSTRFMHPIALAEFKSMLMPVYTAENAAGGRQLLDVTFSSDVRFTDLQAMDPATFMNGFMSLVVAQTGDAPITFDKLEVLGTISENESRHVLTRMTLGTGELAITQFEVLSFLPYEQTWLLQLNGDMKGLATALRSNLPQ